MNYFEAEKKQRELIDQINKEKSPRYVLNEVAAYLNQVSQNIEPYLQEPFVCDLLPVLPKLLRKYSPFGLEPSFTREILLSIQSLSDLKDFSKHSERISSEIEKIEREFVELENSLNAADENHFQNDSVYFPTIEKLSLSKTNNCLIDSLSVTLLEKNDLAADQFILHPSAIDVEKRIKEQVKTSWKYAKTYFEANFRRIPGKYQIVINFQNQYAIYEGASLGVAVTIEFISKLLKYWNLRQDFNIKESIISTGEVEINGYIPAMPEDIIKSKLTGVFYSNFRTFILPKENEKQAKEILAKLLEKYPRRNLNIVAVENISDIINRRDLVKIENMNLLKWGGKKILNNKLSFLLSIFLALLISGYLILSVDNNPAKIDFIKGSAEIKNKYDKLLWSKTNTNFGDVFNNISGLGLLLGRVIDINKDGENEVLLAQIHNSVERDPNIYLFNAQGEEIWKYFHVDTVETIEERFSNTFLIKGIIDTIHNRNVIELLVYFQHENYYPSGILKLDLKTGKRIGEVLWHPGAFGGAALLDWNKDGKKEIIAVGASNGMKRAFLFSIDHDKLKGTFPTAKNYQFLNVDLAAFNNYILFPQSDYSQYFFPKYNAALGIPHIIDSLISVSVHEGKANLIEADFRYDIRFNENLKPNYVVIGDEFIVHRDKLINEGILNPPYTDTDEFRENILNNIEYWNGEKFVKFKSN